jgi:hypothetical protein
MLAGSLMASEAEPGGSAAEHGTQIRTRRRKRDQTVRREEMHAKWKLTFACLLLTTYSAAACSHLVKPMPKLGHLHGKFQTRAEP